ncbi:MAG: hypothetical protein DRN07_04420 [Thermoplasmata archaeon]|nr:MAG: hypothetical protein DRN07_04420 [Thermoplasmata archaeon]
MNGKEIAAALREIGDRLKAAGEKNGFRLKTYKGAADRIESIPNFDDLSLDEIAKIPGFGKGIMAKIAVFRSTGTYPLLEELRRTTSIKERWPLFKALAIVRPVVDALQKKFPEAHVYICGSLRRGKDPKDADVLLAGDGDPARFCEFFRTLGDQSLDQGEKSTGIIKDGLQIDLRIVPRRSVGAGLLFFTGSADFNIRLRGLAKKMGLKLNRDGLFDGDKLIVSETEEEILGALGMKWLEPSMRV